MSNIIELFPVELNQKEYRVYLYDSSDGWNSELRTLIVNEAKGFCQIEYDESRCKNSHGTDWDDIVTLSDPYTLEEMAAYLERNYSPAVIHAKRPDERECYNVDAYTYIPRLRAAAKAYAAAQSGTGNLLTSLLSSQEEVISSRYSDSSAVYHVRNKTDRKEYFLKVSCVPKKQKETAAAVLEKLQQLQEDANLVPIRKILWRPLNSGHELLVIWMPKLTPIAIQADGSGKSQWNPCCPAAPTGSVRFSNSGILFEFRFIGGNNPRENFYLSAPGIRGCSFCNSVFPQRVGNALCNR